MNTAYSVWPVRCFSWTGGDRRRGGPRHENLRNPVQVRREDRPQPCVRHARRWRTGRDLLARGSGKPDVAHRLTRTPLVLHGPWCVLESQCRLYCVQVRPRGGLHAFYGMAAGGRCALPASLPTSVSRGARPGCSRSFRVVCVKAPVGRSPRGSSPGDKAMPRSDSSTSTESTSGPSRSTWERCCSTPGVSRTRSGRWRSSTARWLPGSRSTPGAQGRRPTCGQSPSNGWGEERRRSRSVSYTHLRAHETPEHLVCRLLLEKK